MVLFAVFSALVFAGAVSLRDRIGTAPGDSMTAGGTRQVGDDASDLSPDAASVSPLPDGDQVVTNAAGGYSFSVPANWYVEKNTGTDLTIYPDYDPKSGTPPECKIETSNLVRDAGDLNAWITKYLHADPTAEVSEISRSPIKVGGSSAIEWRGVLNGVTTTLVYVAMPDGILELAPSTLASPSSSANDADTDDCDLALQALMANLNFGNNDAP